MSPEIIKRKKQFDAKKNDVWCLGICLFMMIMAAVRLTLQQKKFRFCENNER